MAKKREVITFEVIGLDYKLVAPVGYAHSEDEAKRLSEITMKRHHGVVATIYFNGIDYLEKTLGRCWKYIDHEVDPCLDGGWLVAANFTA